MNLYQQPGYTILIGWKLEVGVVSYILIYSAWQGLMQMTSRVAALLTLVMLNQLRCRAYLQFSANQITWSRLLIQIHVQNDKQWRSQIIWIYTVCKDRVNPGSAGQGLVEIVINQLW